MTQSEMKMKKIDLSSLLADILYAVKRLWLVGILLMGLFAGGTAISQWRSYTPMYEAYISFTIKVVNPLYSNVGIYNTQTAEQMGKTFPYILSSNALRESVREKLGVPTLPAVTADVIEGTNVFTLRTYHWDPQQAHDVLQAVVECYPEVAEFVLGPTIMVLLDESGVPMAPINVNDPIQNAVKGAVIGAIVWMALVGLMAAARKTVHSEEELQTLLNCPCLGTLPATKVVGRNATNPLAFYDHGKYGFMEANHLLCLHLEREMRDKEKKILLVSSAAPNEGKTTVAANMAISLAQNGNRVLLIDCDLRNPSTSRAIRMTNKKGLSEMLDGKITANDVVRTTSFRDVYLVSAGEGKKHTPADLIASEQFVQLLTASRNVFDYVVLDTAPSGVLSDASEIAELADCALMVVRQDHASRTQILEAAKALTDSKLPVIGSVLNGVKSFGSYGYGYGYGYGYRYKYNYHYGKKKS